MSDWMISNLWGHAAEDRGREDVYLRSSLWRLRSGIPAMDSDAAERYCRDQSVEEKWNLISVWRPSLHTAAAVSALHGSTVELQSLWKGLYLGLCSYFCLLILEEDFRVFKENIQKKPHYGCCKFYCFFWFKRTTELFGFSGPVLLALLHTNTVWFLDQHNPL